MSRVYDDQQAAGRSQSGCSPQTHLWKESFGTVSGEQNCAPGPEAGQALTHQYQQKQQPDSGLPGAHVGPSVGSCTLSNKYTGELPVCRSLAGWNVPALFSKPGLYLWARSSRAGG